MYFLTHSCEVFALQILTIYFLATSFFLVFNSNFVLNLHLHGIKSNQLFKCNISRIELFICDRKWKAFHSSQKFCDGFFNDKQVFAIANKSPLISRINFICENNKEQILRQWIPSFKVVLED